MRKDTMEIKVNALTRHFGRHVSQITTPIVVSMGGVKSNGESSNGLWDTGATNSCITRELAMKLGLKPVNYARVSGVLGTRNDIPVYYVNVTLNNQDISIDLPVTECDRLTDDPSENIGMLLGMDIIGQGDFAISNFNGNTVMTFRRPSCGCTDYVQLLNSMKPAHSDKTGRNDPCPCGSGKKYKNCCGKN